MTCLHPFFAEAAATPTWEATLLVLGFIASLVGNLAQYGMFRTMQKRQQTDISPQPLIVAMEKEFASRRDFDKHIEENKREHDNLFSKVGGVERGAAQRLSDELKSLRQERKEDVSELHEKVNDVAKSVAGLEKETELQNQKMSSMDAKLDRLIERS